MTQLTKPIQQILEYPKFLALLLCCGLSYLLFSTGVLDIFTNTLTGHGYIAVFIAGLMFSFGFTAPFAVGLLLALSDNVDPYLAAAVGGLGAFLSDLFIFAFVRFSFHDEIHKLRATSAYQWIHAILHHERIPKIVRMYLLWSFAGIVIASPFPDELSVTLISSVTSLDTKWFGILCLLLNTVGVFVVLGLGRLVVA